ncbi:hypothetical protein J6590_072378 [Homalodisca vitripennis]|nr:hypothetical protein J6590_072378 [Homalodisca vitripennis]
MTAGELLLWYDCRITLTALIAEHGQGQGYVYHSSLQPLTLLPLPVPLETACLFRKSVARSQSFKVVLPSQTCAEQINSEKGLPITRLNGIDTQNMEVQQADSQRPWSVTFIESNRYHTKSA